MAGWIIFMLLCGILAVMSGDSFIAGALSPVILFGGIGLAVWWFKNRTRENTRKQTLEARSMRCRKCGQMVIPQYQSHGGKTSYNCRCGNSWTIMW